MASPGGANTVGHTQNARSIHDWWASRVETARISLKHMRRFRLATRGPENGARPRVYRVLGVNPAACTRGGGGVFLIKKDIGGGEIHEKLK